MPESLANYLAVSLPENVASSQSALSLSLSLKIQGDIIPFKLPSFKIGTLDSLVQQSEDLVKLDSQLENSITKILDILAAIFDNNSRLILSCKVVNDKPVLQYLETFTWNTSKYRLDKSLNDLIESISTEALNLDNDVRNSYTNYNVAKSNLLAAERKKTGNLSVRSLHDIVKESDFVLNSEHLVTVLVAVPTNLKTDFLHSYETLTEFVIPRSAKVIANDSDFFLYSVTLFKKYQADFIQKARELKWTPREFQYSRSLIDNLKQEFTTASKQENQLKKDLIILAKTSYSEIIASWYHLKIIKIFVESVLRYGLPPNFFTFLIRLDAKSLIKTKLELIDQYGYLGGNAFGLDKNGKIDKNSSNLHESAGLVETDYEPFVLYLLEIN